jgi:hypothetical protein
MEAGHQAAARGSADCRPGIAAGKAQAFTSHLIKARCLDLFLALTPKVSITHIVGQNENDIRLGRGTKPGCRHSQNKRGDEKADTRQPRESTGVTHTSI